LINIYNKLTQKNDDNLEAVEDQAKSLKESIQSVPWEAIATRLDAEAAMETIEKRSKT
jgi:hypothetical protein